MVGVCVSTVVLLLVIVAVLDYRLRDVNKRTSQEELREHKIRLGVYKEFK